MTRVQENRALAIERLAESEKDRDLGLLHLVKAMKELEGMDLDQIEKMLPGACPKCGATLEKNGTDE